MKHKVRSLTLRGSKMVGIQGSFFSPCSTQSWGNNVYEK